MGSPRQLDDLIGSVADGSPIDWNDVDGNALDDRERELLRHLQLVAGVAEVHRTQFGDAESPTDPALVLTPGDRWGQLLLIEKIGEGTYGDVYRARDTWLDREVALKLLKPFGGTDMALFRVLQEARTLARVLHSNVVTVHGADVRNGRVGLWMEFVKGSTLEQLEVAGGQFSAEEAAAIGQQICSALAAVHAAGLVHRDVTARNVMRDDTGRVVLMDFGTGRQQASTGDARTAGTPVYLAPEVLEGGEGTPQSDIYSLGVLLFRLVTGQFPISGPSIGALKEAHARGGRQPLGELRSDLPAPFVRVVERALSAHAADRFPSAQSMYDALIALRPASFTAAEALETPARIRKHSAWWAACAVAAVLALAAWVAMPEARWRAASAVPASPQLIAVLPLTASTEADNYLAFGVTEALMQELARSGSLRVVSRTSVNEARAHARTIPAIAAALDADAILEGALTRAPEGVRVDLRLIHAGSDTPLWVRSFERPLGGLLALQRDVARAVAADLRATFVLPSATATRVRNPAAEDAYLQGFYYLQTPNRASQEQAIAKFEEALRHDAGHARAHAGIARARLVLAVAAGATPLEEGYRLARESASDALALDDGVAEAHAVLAEVNFEHEWDWEGAAREFQRALAINPSLEWARERYAMFLAARDRTGEALAEMEQALQVDPLSPAIRAAHGAILRYARRYDEAVAEYRRVLERHPDHFTAQFGLARTLNAMGRHEEALSMYLAVRGFPNPAYLLAEVAQTEAALQRTAAARATLARLRRAQPNAGFVSADSYAYVYARLGEADRAFAWLERSFQAREASVLWLKVDARVDPLRSDPRFASYVARLDLR